jgi:uncharacterized membrane protein
MGPLRVTHLIYALQALSILTALGGQGLLTLEFAFGVPALLALALAYGVRPRVAGTYLAAHVRWQLATLGRAALALAAATLLFGPALLVGVTLGLGIPLLLLCYIAIGAWTAYRIGRGWLDLLNGRSPPTRTAPP